ncbi:tRNA 2-selenouridine(34) synthase MnmH [Clostridium sp. DJ247]|uniref:tRNA 2-selenouridine(34) synthase MnmH n=1 Tax=Clostridium sp. DJ247 TaxID=2726188 RepID=UPI0016251BC2|nr:tRNA 2-selenouridine(34) synthase MnmH [Clostridium sp. DJ247]MBC2582109.1 tRNA 2-selenouridine(34) synthase MnmH [Clostridium sp. DJ247]
MIKTIEYSEIDENNLKDKYVLIDVRSPGEFSEATIPEAVNVPLFSDEQRKIIGTVYVQESVEKAKKLGIEAASKNLPQIYSEIDKLKNNYNTLIFFCARGGMRSSSLVSLLMSLGINVFKVRGGYKGYRNYINKALPEIVKDIEFVVIHGNTGVGKTSILKRLAEKGFDTLDLEGCANHRGSLLGGIGLGTENSQKQFESLVYEKLKKRKSNVVFVEGESKRIGNIIIPKYIYTSMERGKHINIWTDITLRVKNIMKDYVKDNNIELIEALKKLEKYISSKNINRYISEIEAYNYELVIGELMLKYYDPMYENKKYNYEFTIENYDIDHTCDIIISWKNSL